MTIVVIYERAPPLQIIELIRSLLRARTDQLLIVAGLIFLSIAIIGKLPGGPEVDERGRNFGLVFGVILLVTGLAMIVPGGPIGFDADDGTPTPTHVSPTETVTLPPTQVQPTEIVTPSVGSYPQGFDESGFTDPESAISAHFRALKKQSFTSVLTANREDATMKVEIEADPETRRVHKVWWNNGSIESELYYDSGSVAVRTPGDQGFDSDVPSYVAAAYLEGQLDWFTYSNLSNRQVHRQQGRTVISYFVTSTREDRYHEGELTITANGLVVQYNLRVETGQGEVFVQYRTTDLGETTVEEPDWVDEGE